MEKADIESDQQNLKARVKELLAGFDAVERIKLAELKHSSPFDPSVWDSFFDAFISENPPLPYSGLIEQQRWFMRSRRNTENQK